MKLRYLFLGIVLLGMGLYLSSSTLQSSEYANTTMTKGSSSENGVYKNVTESEVYTIIVNYGNGSSDQAQIECQGSVFDAMNKTMNIKYRMYAGLGAFIECIGGLCQNSTHAWFFYVDGKLANVGVSSYFPRCGENITMVFKSMDHYLNGKK